MDIKEVHALTTENAKELLRNHLQDDPAVFALAHQGRNDIPVRTIAEQIACHKKAVKKLPKLSQKLLFYETVALEQCSSEATARYKTNIIKGKRLFDCTGGLGIDSIFLSDVFNEVVYCEKNPVLAGLFIENIKTLNCNGITVYTEDCVEQLSRYPDNSFDWLYIDPSRRDAHGRYVGFSKCEPDITQHLELFYKKTCNICIKASPAFEITEAEKQLHGLHTIIVVSVEGECKEILFLLNRDTALESQLVKVVMLSSTGEIEIEVERKTTDSVSRICSDTIGRYFYDPDSAIIKARCSEKVAEEFCLSFINKTVDYMTSERCVVDFPGRIFEVVAVIPWQRKRVKQYLKEKNIIKANVARRDFPLAPEEIKGMLDLADGGEEFLFFTRDIQRRLIVVRGKKVREV